MKHINRQWDFTDKDLQEVYRKSEAADVITIPRIRDQFLDRVEVEPSAHGMTLPWSDVDDKVRLRTGEVSVWAGINGHKKSTVVSQVAVHMSQQVPVGIASFEMKLSDTAYMMCKQAGAVDRPTKQFAEDFMSWADNRIWLYRALGGVKPLEALGAISAFADRGCKLVVLDNLQFCGVTEDIEKERLFVNQLVGMSEALQIHIAVVHHVRKPQSGGDEYVPTRFDVRGGGTIVDQAHLLFICWHNKAKAQIEYLEEMGVDTGERGVKMKYQPNFKLIVAKQRHAPFEGTIKLWEGKGQTFKRYSNQPSIRIDVPRANA
jgi:twinkle protein